MRSQFKKNVKSMTFVHKASVIRQKGESPNGFFKKTKHAKFSEKRNISYPLLRTRTYIDQFFDQRCE